MVLEFWSGWTTFGLSPSQITCLWLIQASAFFFFSVSISSRTDNLLTEVLEDIGATIIFLLFIFCYTIIIRKINNHQMKVGFVVVVKHWSLLRYSLKKWFRLGFKVPRESKKHSHCIMVIECSKLLLSLGMWGAKKQFWTDIFILQLKQKLHSSQGITLIKIWKKKKQKTRRRRKLQLSLANLIENIEIWKPISKSFTQLYPFSSSSLFIFKDIVLHILHF